MVVNRLHGRLSVRCQTSGLNQLPGEAPDALRPHSLQRNSLIKTASRKYSAPVLSVHAYAFVLVAYLATIESAASSETVTGRGSVYL